MPPKVVRYGAATFSAVVLLFGLIALFATSRSVNWRSDDTAIQHGVKIEDDGPSAFLIDAESESLPVIRNVRLINCADSDVDLRVIGASCKCVRADINRNSLHFGDFAELTVAIMPPVAATSKQKAVIALEASRRDGTVGFLSVSIETTFVRDVWPEPRLIQFSADQKSASFSVFTVRRASSEPKPSLSVAGTPEWMRVSVPDDSQEFSLNNADLQGFQWKLHCELLGQPMSSRERNGALRLAVNAFSGSTMLFYALEGVEREKKMPPDRGRLNSGSDRALQ